MPTIKASTGASARAGAVSPPRKPTPPPWTPSASSCFSRPEPPPLQAFGGTPRTEAVVQRDDRGAERSGLLTVPVAATAAGTVSSPVEVMAPVGAAASRGPASPRVTAPLCSLWAGSMASRPAVALEPVALTHPLVAMEISDSVPMLVCKPREEPEASRGTTAAPGAERKHEPAAPSMLALVLQSSISTAKMPRIIVDLPPTRAPAVTAPASLRRRLALALGTAAALVLVLAVDLATSPIASPRTEHDVARDGLSLATNLVIPSALALPWTSSEALVDAPTPAPSPVVPALVAPLPSADQRLALAVTNPADAVSTVLEPAPKPRRARWARHRGHAPTVTTVETTPEPTPAPRRSSGSRKPRSVSVEELLFDGEVALRLGDAKQAYRLAKRSRDTGARTDAASLVARSACRLGERDEAKQALRDLPLLERGAVRRDCRRSGGRIGL